MIDRWLSSCPITLAGATGDVGVVGLDGHGVGAANLLRLNANIKPA